MFKGVILKALEHFEKLRMQSGVFHCCDLFFLSLLLFLFFHVQLDADPRNVIEWKLRTSYCRKSQVCNIFTFPFLLFLLFLKQSFQPTIKKYNVHFYQTTPSDTLIKLPPHQHHLTFLATTNITSVNHHHPTVAPWPTGTTTTTTSSNNYHHKYLPSLELCSWLPQLAFSSPFFLLLCSVVLWQTPGSGGSLLPSIPSRVSSTKHLKQLNDYNWKLFINFDGIGQREGAACDNHFYVSHCASSKRECNEMDQWRHVLKMFIVQLCYHVVRSVLGAAPRRESWNQNGAGEYHCWFWNTRLISANLLA